MDKQELQTTAPNDALLSAAVNAALREVVIPVIGSLAELMKNNTEALQSIAAQQKVQTDRLEALEKQMRLSTPVTPTQVKYMNEGIKNRTKELLAKRNVEDKKAVAKLSSIIRKAVQTRYGVAALSEIPRHEYSVAMQQIGTWHDAILVREIARQFRNQVNTGTDKDCSGLVEDDYHV